MYDVCLQVTIRAYKHNLYLVHTSIHTVLQRDLETYLFYIYEDLCQDNLCICDYAFVKT